MEFSSWPEYLAAVLVLALVAALLIVWAIGLLVASRAQRLRLRIVPPLDRDASDEEYLRQRAKMRKEGRESERAHRGYSPGSHKK